MLLFNMLPILAQKKLDVKPNDRGKRIFFKRYINKRHRQKIQTNFVSTSFQALSLSAFSVTKKKPRINLGV